MKHTFEYGTYSYEYYVEYAERKTFGLEVRPDLRIIVKVPLATQPGEIEKFLTRKWLWLEKNLTTLQKYRKTHFQKQYVSGEAFYYLGRQYMLQVDRDSLDMVKLERGKLHVYTTRGLRSSSYTEKLLENWFAKRRKVIFLQEYRRAGELFDYPTLPELHERVMSRRWGSYSGDGGVYLNPRLIQASKEAIYYVCVHELCHVANKKHNAAFYEALQNRVSNWQIIKSALEINFG